MKNTIVFILLFCSFFKSTSQTIIKLKDDHYPIYTNTSKEEFLKIKENYKNLSKPSTNNWLAEYLATFINAKDLKNLKKIPLVIRKNKSRKKFDGILLNPLPLPSYLETEKPKYYKNDVTSLVGKTHSVKIPERIIRNDVVLLSFIVTEAKAILNPNIKTGISSLDEKLRQAFLKIPIEKLGLENAETPNIYTVQILEYKEGNPLINASDLAIKSEEFTLWDNPNIIIRNSPEGYHNINVIEKHLFKKLSHTTDDNYLSNLLKKELTDTDLKKLQQLRFSSHNHLNLDVNPSKETSFKPANEQLFSEYPYLIKNNIVKYSFSVNEKNKVTYAFVYTGDRNLDKKLIQLFKTIPLEKLGLQEAKNTGDYEIQLYEYTNDIPFINASTTAIPALKLFFLNIDKEMYDTISIKRKNLYKKLSKPSQNGVLAKYLKKKINRGGLQLLKKSKLLAKISNDTILNSFNSENGLTLRNDIITLSFKLTKKKNKTRQSLQGFYLTKSKNSKTNKLLKNNYVILDEFLTTINEIPLSKLGLPKNATPGYYSIQLFEYKDDIPFINASTIALREEESFLKNCAHLNKKYKKKNCLKQTINNHILENITATSVAKQKERGEINITVKFNIDIAGRIENIVSIAPNKILEDAVNKAMESFNDEFIPATKNKIPVISKNKTVKFKIFIEDNK